MNPITPRQARQHALDALQRIEEERRSAAAKPLEENMSDERIKRLERHVDRLDAMVVGLVIAVLLLFVMVTYVSEPPIIERPEATSNAGEDV